MKLLDKHLGKLTHTHQSHSLRVSGLVYTPIYGLQVASKSKQIIIDISQHESDCIN